MLSVRNYRQIIFRCRRLQNSSYMQQIAPMPKANIIPNNI